MVKLSLFSFQHNWQQFKNIATVLYSAARSKTSSGNSSRSTDIVQPNFENVWPLSFTLWLDTMTEHLTSTSWVTFFAMLSGNKFCLVQFVKCWTKRKILKDINYVLPKRKTNICSTVNRSLWRLQLRKLLQNAHFPPFHFINSQPEHCKLNMILNFVVY